MRRVRNPLLLSRDDSEHPGKMRAELGHEVAQKGRHRFVDNLSISGKDLW
jgi:hypothetical protein